jgi:hypothetical protein
MKDRVLKLRNQSILYEEDLSIGRKEFGFTVYKNVIVLLNEEHDDRIFGFIDGLDNPSRDYLKIAY